MQVPNTSYQISKLAGAVLICGATSCGNQNVRSNDDVTVTDTTSSTSTATATSSTPGVVTPPQTPTTTGTTSMATSSTTTGAASSGDPDVPTSESVGSTPEDSIQNPSTGASADPTSASTTTSGDSGADSTEALPPAVCPQTYSNPLIWEDLPDLEVFRVHDAYYYTSSSFHYSPGAPLLRSYDLVHWEYVSHSVPALDVHASYDLPSGDNAYVNGIWASTLQYRKSNETFYWMGCMHNAGGGWVFTSPSPEGPWEKHRGGCYYDMGLLIDDDDTMYVAYGNNTISVAQLSADGFSEVESQSVYQTPGNLSGPLEGSRFYKINGDYYIFVTQYANGEYVLRSTNGPFGPYEMKPFAVRVPYAGVGAGGSPHQGGIIETQNGDWYYIAFNDSYPAGRLPVMAPITWSDGWPSVTLVDGKWGASYPFPNLPCGSNRVSPPKRLETFPGPTLDADWQWNHNPDTAKWSADGGLTLQTATVTSDLYAARNTLTRRIAGPISTATIELDHSSMQDGDVAGLAVLRDVSAAIAVQNVGGNLRVYMANGINMNTSWETTSTGTIIDEASLTGSKVWLRAEANVRTDNGGGRANFSYSTDGSQFQPLGDTLVMNKDWQFFLGYRFGLFNYATKSLGGSVTIEKFELATP